jgi:hypothetical protein
MVRYKGKDQIEFGHKFYDEASYGGSPGATPTTLYRIGHVQEISPSFDPELNRIFTLKDGVKILFNSGSKLGDISWTCPIL